MNGDNGVLWTLDLAHASAQGTECLSFASQAMPSKSFLNKIKKNNSLEINIYNNLGFKQYYRTLHNDEITVPTNSCFTPNIEDTISAIIFCVVWPLSTKLYVCPTASGRFDKKKMALQTSSTCIVLQAVLPFHSNRTGSPRLRYNEPMMRFGATT